MTRSLLPLMNKIGKLEKNGSPRPNFGGGRKMFPSIVLARYDDLLDLLLTRLEFTVKEWDGQEYE